MLRTRKSIVAAALVGAVGMTLATGGTAGAATTLKASLSGKKEVPQAADGSGSARITLRARKRQVCFDITLKNVGTTVMGHIHKGGKSVAGPIVVPLYDSPETQPSGCVSAKRKLISAIKRHPRRYYVNVHTAEFPAGAARGQLHR
jgi:hypothetical protein